MSLIQRTKDLNSHLSAGLFTIKKQETILILVKLVSSCSSLDFVAKNEVAEVFYLHILPTIKIAAYAFLTVNTMRIAAPSWTDAFSC